MNTNKWHMHRLGLVDFWYYVNEEFLFKDGHMLLRGSNGSGKSVTMQSFIPLLLDGNRSSERLDAFGTRSRKLENYLLEEDSDRDDRIGYLYLEFKKADSERFKTIGMGLHARKNKPMDVWYFVIEDNRRINRDIRLMEHNLALTKAMLKNIIHEQLITSQKEYMEKVNQALFGFPSSEEYKETLNLLMQLRSPKLSNSLKPTMINEILSNSLQPLSEEDLRPMSEAISSMDDIEDQLTSLKQSLQSAQAIEQVYTQYNHAVLQHKATRYLDAQAKLSAAQENKKHIQKQIVDTETCITENQQNNTRLETEKAVLAEEKSTIAKADLIQIKEDADRLKQELIKNEVELQKKHQLTEEKNEAWIEIDHKIKEQENQAELSLSEINHAIKELDDIQTTLEFSEHEPMKAEIMNHLEQEYHYAYINTNIKKETDQIKQGLKYFDDIKDHEIRFNHQKEEKARFLSEQEQKEATLETETKKLLAAVERIKDEFYIWNADNRILKLSDKQLMTITEHLQTFLEEDSFPMIHNMIQNEYQKAFEQKIKEIQQAKQTIQAVETKQRELKAELHHWETMEDSKPPVDEKIELNRKLLNELHIPYLPFYTLLEFHPSLDLNTKNHIEELLLRMGLLNALIVEESYREHILKQKDHQGYDTYLFTDKKLDSLHSFEIRWNDSNQMNLDRLLNFFRIKNQNAYIKSNYYQNGIITGTISRNESARYIGKKTREAFRKQKIKEYQNELEVIQQEYQTAVDKHKQAEADKKRLLQEYENAPKQDILVDITKTILQTESKLTEIRQQLIRIEENIRTITSRMSQTMALINEIAQALHMKNTKQAFSDRYDSFEDYKAVLNQFIQAQRDYAAIHSLLTSNKQHQATIQDNLDTLRYDISMMQNAYEKNKALVLTKEKQLKEYGFEDVMKRLDEINQRLHDIDDKILEIRETIGSKSQKVLDYKEKLQTCCNEISVLEAEQTKCHNYYIQEANLSYVIPDTIAKEDVKAVVAFIQKANLIKKRKDLLENDLHTSFHNHRGNLQEYNITILPLFQKEEEGVSRLDISARYQGKKVKFAKLVTYLREDIEQQKLLLEESDRILIEDILVNTISKKIRNHIQSSQQWVNDMNKFMNSMNSSSGLKLRLQWKSRKAENEEELNSEKLVELLMKDLRLLNDTDKKRLSTHFRSRIQSAREQARQEDSSLSFHTAMKSVMDYRTWFDFKILYEKTGEKRKEMTNHSFYAFSGGEKAMSMYIPLFSAVAAKFESTYPDAPIIIALDEAFAGVDEKNIQNMFELIRKFRFDYIMNSQVLWGDYPSVPSLAIHELFRPENAKYVTVITYEWDGHKKRMVNS